MDRKSYYDLRFGVSPGGARKDAHYFRGSLDEVRADLAAELADGMNLYLLCWYGAELALDVYQHGRRTRSIDLHPFVTIDIDGYPPITFTGPGAPVGYDFGTDEEQGVDDGSLSDLLFMGELEAVTRVTVDWAGIDAPALLGEPAQRGDLLVLDERPIDDANGDLSPETAGVWYGFVDFEA
ncbi:hypothetical protein Cme02nite_04100 [Catellatospora methionotrophica]|uniref:Uncharacterized protein n=1 Tax=Catellatospora methionotrophica TaxID=121620 RepID=A0A8J3PD68_9ACTN|nr:hypothetical protein [Catellatospora methionotrophica]GIG12078.1 hypothetical protein Cme02nite_04100 [Catellatospora methionotrophica]